MARVGPCSLGVQGEGAGAGPGQGQGDDKSGCIGAISEGEASVLGRWRGAQDRCWDSGGGGTICRGKPRTGEEWTRWRWKWACCPGRSYVQMHLPRPRRASGRQRVRIYELGTPGMCTRRAGGGRGLSSWSLQPEQREAGRRAPSVWSFQGGRQRRQSGLGTL